MDTAIQPSLYLMKDVVAVLDEKNSDVYSMDVRVRLAECALRHAGSRGTNPMKVNRAVAWLRSTGHIQ